MVGRLQAPERHFPIAHVPVDLVATTFPLRQGAHDPTTRVAAGQVWRALRTASGPATLHLRVDGGELVARAIGPGSAQALELAPRLAGLHDDPTALRPLHQVVAEARRRTPGLRLTSGTGVFDALVWTVLAQKVVGFDARRAYRDLVGRLGEPAPGDAGLFLPPDPGRIARTPYWIFHECNVERRRATVIVDAARRAGSLDALAALPPAEARARLQSLPGIGPWTAAEVTAVSHGDPDAVPLGDYHVPNAVAYALAREPRADDARMLELLEPYAGQRGRVIRLLMSGGRGAPRYGPKLSRQDIRAR
ncbi:MAG: DNA-3-methyladenine glycosylase 2 family protein [Candidatus Dormibacteraeota bacterium]|nr:DNA-3-methyladenine glycosylase 2 family protein [Candidatus Dormibacteraeota bacterium]